VVDLWTNSERNRKLLAAAGFHAHVLPVFSNIRIGNLVADRIMARQFVIDRFGGDASAYIILIFGALADRLPLQKTLSTLTDSIRKANRVPVFLYMGRNHTSPEIDTLKNICDALGTFHNLRTQEEPEAARFLAGADLGVSTTRSRQITRSTSVAAFLEAGLPVLLPDTETAREAALQFADSAGASFWDLHRLQQEGMPPAPPTERPFLNSRRRCVLKLAGVNRDDV
jgi:glycosyltransferase involved in cell wall biosynthesis